MNDHPNAPGNRDDEPRTVRGDVQAPQPNINDQTLAVDLAGVEIDRQIATAHKYPRRIDIVIKRVEQIALYDEASADRCVYFLPRAGKPIPGPSIGLMNILAGAYGNCRVAARQTYIDRREKLVYADGYFIDLETNVTTQISVSRRISGKDGRLYNDDMIGVTAMAATSIARRNAIRHGISEGIWHPVYEKARFIVAGSIETLPARREAALKALMQFGIDPKKVFLYFQVKDIEGISVEHIPALRGMYTALREGQVTAEEMFDPRRMTGRDFDQVDNPLGGDDDQDQDKDIAGGSSPANAADRPVQTKPSQADRSAAPVTEKTRTEDDEGEIVDTGPRKAAEKDSAETVPDKPAAEKTNGDERAAGISAVQTTRAAETGEIVFPKPYAAQSGAAYLDYLKAWTAKAATAYEVDDRFKSERTIRNALAHPALDAEQLDQVKAIRQAAIDRLS